MWIIKNLFFAIICTIKTLFFKINDREGERAINIMDNPIQFIILWGIVIIDIIAGVYYLFYPFSDYLFKYLIVGVLFVFAFTTSVCARTSITWMFYAPCMSVCLLGVLYLMELYNGKF